MPRLLHGRAAPALLPEQRLRAGVLLRAAQFPADAGQGAGAARAGGHAAGAGVADGRREHDCREARDAAGAEAGDGQGQAAGVGVGVQCVDAEGGAGHHVSLAGELGVHRAVGRGWLRLPAGGGVGVRATPGDGAHARGYLAGRGAAGMEAGYVYRKLYGYPVLLCWVQSLFASGDLARELCCR